MNGVTVERMKPITVVINRGKGEEPLVAVCKPIISYEAFNKIFPLPLPPEVMLKGGTRELNTKDPEYLARITEYSEAKVFYLFLESVRGSIEWDTVKDADPTTWKNCEQEMKESGLSAKEIEMVFDGVFEANAMNEEKMEQARKSFLAGRGEK